MSARLRARRRRSLSGLALLAAALLFATAPPRDLWPLGLVALAPLLLAVRRASILGAAALGWGTAFGLGLLIFQWWPPVLTRFAGVSPWAAVAIAIGVCGYQASRLAIWAGACRGLQRWAGVPWMVSGPLCMVVVESTIPFVFDWHLGTAFSRAWPLIQVAELGGPSAVSALLVLINVCVVEAAVAIGRGQRPGRTLGAGIAVVALALGWGGLRGAAVERARLEAPSLRVGLVQPNFGVTSVDMRARHAAQYLHALRQSTQELTEAGAELVVWPESAWPYLFDRSLALGASAERSTLDASPRTGRLLFGALTQEPGSQHTFNSAVLVSAAGHFAGLYDKRGLIPFVEYAPLEPLVPELGRRLRERWPDFPRLERGRASQVVSDGALRIAPLICSEELSPLLASHPARSRANLLVGLTNDAWFGPGALAHQHLGESILRAVEVRRDYVRATNTGVSAYIDALGRVRTVSDLLTTDDAAPTTLLVDVALLELPALGPTTIPWLPPTTVLLLIAATGLYRRNQLARGK